MTTATEGLRTVVESFGENDTTTSKVQYYVGMIMSRAGHYLEAEAAFRDALRIGRNKLDPLHPLMGRYVNGLGLCLKYQGRYQEAQPLYEEAIQIKQQVLGNDDPALANSLNNMAEILALNGDLREAEGYYQRALSIREQSLGESDPATIRSIFRLGDHYREWGKYLLAEPMLTRAVALAQTHLDTNSVDLAEALFSLADLYSEYGRFADARPLYERTVEIWRSAEHSNLPTGLQNLCKCSVDEGDYLAAERQCIEALEEAQRWRGEDHPELIPFWSTLGRLHQKMNIHDKALKEYQRALDISEAAYGGRDHYQLAWALNDLGFHYTRMGMLNEAELLLLKALDSWQNHYGRDHLMVANAMESIAELRLAQDRIAEAVDLATEATDIMARTVGIANHSYVTAILMQTRLSLQIDSLGISGKLLDKLKQILTDNFDTNHPQAARYHELRSRWHLLRDQADQALSEAQQAQQIWATNLRRAVMVLPEDDALSYARNLRSATDLSLYCLMKASIPSENVDTAAANLVSLPPRA